jgi:hypothetical protein
MPQQFAELILKGNMSAQGSNTINVVNVFHYARTAGTGAPDKASLATSFQTIVLPSILAVLNNSLTYTDISVRWFDDVEDPFLDVTISKPGGVSGDRMAPQNAVFILLRTGKRGKSFKGGHHFGPLSESDTTAPASDVLNAAALSNWTNVELNLKANLSDSGSNTWTPFIFSRRKSQFKTNPTNIVGATVAQALINKRIGRMRHREVKSVY